MMKTTSSLFIAAVLMLGLQIGSAHAQLARTFVSSAGSDANDCSRFAPCRTFQTAHDKTFSDGEVTVLDPGGYGGLTITKSISIVNDGVGEASILVSGGATGITINAGPAAYVNLHGITIQGIGFGGGVGLRFNSGFSLTIENCVIRNHTGDGIRFAPSGSSSLEVTNTLVADNGGHGIAVIPTGTGIAKAAFSRVGAHNNSKHGMFISADSSSATGITGTATDSVAANNGAAGFAVSSFLGFTTSFVVVRSVAANNHTGLFATSSAAILRAGQSTVTGNITSWAVPSGGQILSYGDNNIDANGDGGPPLPVIAKK